MTGSGTYDSYSGDKVIGVYTWVPGLQVALVAEQEEAEALAPTRRALGIIGGRGAGGRVSPSSPASGLTRRIVRPLAELGETAGRIADGELDLRATVVREDEIGTLARAFNRMTGQLGLLVGNLERRTEPPARPSTRPARQISSILELEELLPYVAKSILETFGYDMVRVFLLTDCCSGQLVICARRPVLATLEVDLTEPVDLTRSGPDRACGLDEADRGRARRERRWT